MPQDIKSFYNITGINTHNQLEVELRIRHHGHTVSNISLNGNKTHWEQYISYWDLFSPINLQVELVEFTEGTSGIEIEYFGINGLEILPKYQHLSSSKKCYIANLGIWELSIPANFYTWYHEISGQGFIA